MAVSSSVILVVCGQQRPVAVRPWLSCLGSRLLLWPPPVGPAWAVQLVRAGWLARKAFGLGGRRLVGPGVKWNWSLGRKYKVFQSWDSFDFLLAYFNFLTMNGISNFVIVHQASSSVPSFLSSCVILITRSKSSSRSSAASSGNASPRRLK